MENLRLQETVVFLAAAGLVIPLVKRLRVSPVLGFLLIGLALGPHGLARLAGEHAWLRHVLITDVEGVNALAELGVVFLLFMIGLELSLERLWDMRRLVFAMGSAQILLSALAIGAIAWAFGNTLAASVVLGSCLALSSTAVVMQLLTEQGRFGTAVGHGTFAILLAQDIAVVPILFVVGALGAQGGDSLAWALTTALMQALLAVAVILGVGRLVLRPVFHFVSASRSPELFMAATLLIIVATAAATHAAGLSAALGAFLAGLLFAETEFRHEIETNIEPFKGLLLGLFFMSVGMRTDLAEIADNPVLIAASVLGLFALKGALAATVARLSGFSRAQAVEMGLLLAQGGEFALVVVSLAAALALVPEATAQFMLIVVAATMFLTPLVARLARRAGTALERPGDEFAGDLAPDLRDHVVIVGYGRTGRMLAQLLDRQHIAHVALDLDAERVRSLHARGAAVYLGDASRAALLAKTHPQHAAALVITTGSAETSERVLLAARALAPQLPVLVRARDSEHAARLLSLGASHAVPEVLEAGLQLGQVMLEQSGLPADTARELVDAQRARALAEAVAPPPG